MYGGMPSTIHGRSWINVDIRAETNDGNGHAIATPRFYASMVYASLLGYPSSAKASQRRSQHGQLRQRTMDP